MEAVEVSPVELRAEMLRTSAAACAEVLAQVLAAERHVRCPRCADRWRRVLPCVCPRGCMSVDYQFGMPLVVADARGPAARLPFDPGEWVLEVAATLRRACECLAEDERACD